MTITVDGKLHIKRYMAGLVPNIAQSIAIGAGDVAESTSQKQLQFESIRSNVTLTSLDLVNNRVVYRASLPANWAGEVREVAIYSMAVESASVESSRLITAFDSGTENWRNYSTDDPSTFSNISRVGPTSLEQLPTASTVVGDYLGVDRMDLSQYSGTDKFAMAFNCSNSNTDAVSWTFLTDSTNYYQFSVGAQTSGYKIIEFNKSAAVPTGTPDWSNITSIMVSSSASGAGSSHTIFDGIRLNRSNNINPNYVMVAREVLPLPYTKTVGRIIEIEFSLGITA